MSMKISNYTIGKRTRDLPACSAVLQPTAPPRAPLIWKYKSQDNVRAVTSVKQQLFFFNFQRADKDSCRLVSGTVTVSVHPEIPCCIYLQQYVVPCSWAVFILKMRAIRLVETSAARHTTIHRHIQEDNTDM